MDGPSERMKRLPPSRFDDYKPAFLYLDDLSRIVEHLRTVGGEDLTIVADGHQFVSVDDLPLLGTDAVADVKVQGYRPTYFTFEVRPYLARLYLSNTDDVRADAAAAAIRQIVEGRAVRRGPTGKPAYGVWLRKSTDPAPPKPPGWREQNPELIAAVIGAAAGAVATGAVTVILVLTGVLGRP